MRMRIVSAWFQSAPRIASTGWHLQQGCARKRKRNPVAALRCRTMCRRWSSRHLERRARPRPLGEPRRSGPVGSLAHSICILGRRNCGGRKEAHSDSGGGQGQEQEPPRPLLESYEAWRRGDSGSKVVRCSMHCTSCSDAHTHTRRGRQQVPRHSLVAAPAARAQCLLHHRM